MNPARRIMLLYQVCNSLGAADVETGDQTFDQATDTFDQAVGTFDGEE